MVMSIHASNRPLDRGTASYLCGLIRRKRSEASIGFKNAEVGRRWTLREHVRSIYRRKSYITYNTPRDLLNTIPSRSL